MSDVFVTEVLNHNLDGTWVVVLDAYHIPPHVLMVQDNKSWSLEHNGLHVRPAESLIKLVKRKKIKTVFFEIIDVGPEVENAFKSYQNLGTKSTCLQPIRNFFANAVDEGLQVCEFVFELIPALSKKGVIGSVKQLNLETPVYSFPKYNKNQILKHISRLKSTKVL